MKLREEAQEFHIQQFSRTIPGIFNKMFIMLCGTRWAQKKGFERLSLKKKSEKKFLFCSNHVTIFYDENQLLSRKTWDTFNKSSRLGDEKECLFFSLVKKQQRQKFQQKKEAKKRTKTLLVFFSLHFFRQTRCCFPIKLFKSFCC